MNKKMLAVGMLMLSGAVLASSQTAWKYSGEAGPDHWSSLSPEFGSCAGKNQSPVNLTGFIDAKLKPIAFSYKAGVSEILNNGHTIQLNALPGSGITLDGTRFELKQFHFHAPSENQLNGKSFAMEAHLVHADKDGNLAVVAVMFEEGKPNPAIEQAWAQMPKTEGEHLALAAKVSPLGVLPRHRAYYRFNGSLTTPPCSEGVRWLVMKQPMSASKEQIEAFAHVMHHPNNRPVQALNARAVLR
jgi:carbonic anhydrase